MFASMLLSVLLVVAMQIAAQAQPPMILQVFREPLKPRVEAEYDRIESDTARKCAKLRCLHPYLGVESLTGPKEVWWFNGYDSAAEVKQVADAWAKNKPALTAVERNSKRKARLTDKGINAFANYRQDLSAGPPWVIGHGRFLVITVTNGAPQMNGTVFETDAEWNMFVDPLAPQKTFAVNGTRFVIVAAQTREEADAAAAADAESRVFAVRPSWSHPALDWIAADPEFWRQGHLSNR